MSSFKNIIGGISLSHTRAEIGQSLAQGILRGDDQEGLRRLAQAYLQATETMSELLSSEGEGYEDEV